jgi:hypothetical protein
VSGDSDDDDMYSGAWADDYACAYDYDYNYEYDYDNANEDDGDAGAGSRSPRLDDAAVRAMHEYTSKVVDLCVGPGAGCVPDPGVIAAQLCEALHAVLINLQSHTYALNLADVNLVCLLIKAVVGVVPPQAWVLVGSGADGVPVSAAALLFDVAYELGTSDPECLPLALPRGLVTHALGTPMLVTGVLKALASTSSVHVWEPLCCPEVWDALVSLSRTCSLMPVVTLLLAAMAQAVRSLGVLTSLQGSTGVLTVLCGTLQGPLGTFCRGQVLSCLALILKHDRRQGQPELLRRITTTGLLSLVLGTIAECGAKGAVDFACRQECYEALTCASAFTSCEDTEEPLGWAVQAGLVPAVATLCNADWVDDHVACQYEIVGLGVDLVAVMLPDLLTDPAGKLLCGTVCRWARALDQAAVDDCDHILTATIAHFLYNVLLQLVAERPPKQSLAAMREFHAEAPVVEAALHIQRLRTVLPTMTLLNMFQAVPAAQHFLATAGAGSCATGAVAVPTRDT